MRRIAVFGLVITGLLCLPLSAEARCGKERWAVKTGTDRDAQQVDTSVHNVTRIAAMRSWPAPNQLPATTRIAPYELKVWVVDATLKAYKVEDDPRTGDSDYHLVLADDSGNTIIAEIPLRPASRRGAPSWSLLQTRERNSTLNFRPLGNFRTRIRPSGSLASGFSIFTMGRTEWRRMPWSYILYSKSSSQPPDRSNRNDDQS